MGKTLHLPWRTPAPVSFRYKKPDAIDTVRVITVQPVQGPLDRRALTHVPIATGTLATETTNQRVVVVAEEGYSGDTGGLPTISVPFEDAVFIQDQLRMDLCVLCVCGDDTENKSVAYIKRDAPPTTARPSHLRQ